MHNIGWLEWYGWVSAAGMRGAVLGPAKDAAAAAGLRSQ